VNFLKYFSSSFISEITEKKWACLSAMLMNTKKKSHSLSRKLSYGKLKLIPPATWRREYFNASLCYSEMRMTMTMMMVYSNFLVANLQAKISEAYVQY
jgi:hypothetical protein